MASVPFAFLTGLMRSRLSRAAAVSDLVSRLGEADRRQGLRDALAEGLGDPTLSLAYWVPGLGRLRGRRRASRSSSRGRRGRTPTVEHDGGPVAMIRHDPALDDEPELLQGVAAAAALALENERLDVELRARVEELRASRARIVEAADEERRRLERDLHDGAQQRLVSLALNLRLASRQARHGPGRCREPARGERRRSSPTRRASCASSPAACTPPCSATAACARRSRRSRAGRRCRSSWRAPSPERLPPAVESASYFVVAEALTNVARYAERLATPRSASTASTAGSRSRSATTASAAPTPNRARACAGSPTGSRRSTGGSRWSAREAEGPSCGR